MKALLLAAGRGTRLGDLTRDLPKPLLPIGDQPLIAHTLRYLGSQGFDDVAVNLGFEGHRIAEFVGDGSRFGVRVRYSLETELLGTAGAVTNFLDFFRDEHAFLVIYGDLLIDQDLGALVGKHRQVDADATLLVHQRARSNSQLRLAPDGRIVDFVERPADHERRDAGYSWVNSGVYLLHWRVIDLIPRGRASDFARDIFSAQCALLRLFAVPLSGYRCAIDGIDRYEEAQRAFETGAYRAQNLPPR